MPSREIVDSRRAVLFFSGFVLCRSITMFWFFFWKCLSSPKQKNLVSEITVLRMNQAALLQSIGAMILCITFLLQPFGLSNRWQTTWGEIFATIGFQLAAVSQTFFFIHRARLVYPFRIGRHPFEYAIVVLSIVFVLVDITYTIKSIHEITCSEKGCSLKWFPEELFTNATIDAVVSILISVRFAYPLLQSLKVTKYSNHAIKKSSIAMKSTLLCALGVSFRTFLFGSSSFPPFNRHVHLIMMIDQGVATFVTTESVRRYKKHFWTYPYPSLEYNSKKKNCYC